jgi:hypothetical protein
MALLTNLRIVFGFLRCIKAGNCNVLRKYWNQSLHLYVFHYNHIQDAFPLVYFKIFHELQPSFEILEKIFIYWSFFTNINYFLKALHYTKLVIQKLLQKEDSRFFTGGVWAAMKAEKKSEAEAEETRLSSLCSIFLLLA